jgi:hypothetical protein
MLTNMERVLMTLASMGRRVMLGEASSRSGLHFRCVAYLLAERCRNGTVAKVGAIRYELAAPAFEREFARDLSSNALDELFECVRHCEAEWPVRDQPASRRSSTDGRRTQWQKLP